MVQQSLTTSHSIRNSSYLAAVHPIGANQVPDPAVQIRTLNEAIKVVRDLGLNPEVCGTWVWIFGVDGSYEASFRALGFRWSSKKGCWYWCSKTKFKPKHISWSMEKIREKYGSRRVAD